MNTTDKVGGRLYSLLRAGTPALPEYKTLYYFHGLFSVNAIKNAPAVSDGGRAFFIVSGIPCMRISGWWNLAYHGLHVANLPRPAATALALSTSQDNRATSAARTAKPLMRRFGGTWSGEPPPGGPCRLAVSSKPVKLHAPRNHTRSPFLSPVTGATGECSAAVHWPGPEWPCRSAAESEAE